MDETLVALGVTRGSLRPEEVAQLDRHGYVVLADVVDAGSVDRLRNAFERVVTEGHESTGRDAGTRHADGLPGDHDAFDAAFVAPRVLAAVHHMIGRPFRVMVFGARDPSPGFGQQGLHADWPPRSPGEPCHVATALICLDDFTEASGATRVVPGTHRVPAWPPKGFRAPDRRHPDELVVEASAGSVLVFNGHLWHGGTRNRSRGPRRALQIQYVAVEMTPPGNERADAPDRLTPAARRILTGS